MKKGMNKRIRERRQKERERRDGPTDSATSSVSSGPSSSQDLHFFSSGQQPHSAQSVWMCSDVPVSMTKSSIIAKNDWSIVHPSDKIDRKN